MLIDVTNYMYVVYEKYLFHLVLAECVKHFTLKFITVT